MSRTKRGPGRQTLAQRADKYECYQQSVQEPEAEIPVIQRVFRKHRGRAPRSLREDFCGTAAMSCAWVREHRENSAVGIDLDPECLAWGARHNVRALAPEQQARVKLIEGDVLDVGHEPVDVTVAFNFSYFLFHTRQQMLRYLRRARATLGADGILFLDAYGGTEAQQPRLVRRACKGFTYVWEQRSFDPIHNWGQNFIHYEFPDGSAIRRAFRYDWRIWTIPELREILADAGFSRSEVYWEGTCQRTGRGNDRFVRRERAEPDPAWIAYLAALA
jgi:SAM-dependent methyltransferase